MPLHVFVTQLKRLAAQGSCSSLRELVRKLKFLVYEDLASIIRDDWGKKDNLPFADSVKLHKGKDSATGKKYMAMLKRRGLTSYDLAVWYSLAECHCRDLYNEFGGDR